MVERLSAAGQHIALPDAIMITGTDDHDPPETMITINWIERSRWSGIGDHDRPECAPIAARMAIQAPVSLRQLASFERSVRANDLTGRR
jgi:hypothetical protein